MKTIKADLILKGGTLVHSDRMYAADLVVQDGQIAAVTDGILPDAENVLDVTGRYILPGIIDSHVHLRYPGNPDRETFATGTRAAAAGGVTTILEHPISEPAVSTVEILRRREEMCSPQAHVDYGFFGAAGEDNLEDIGPMAQEGVVAFKTFLHEAPPGREDEFAGLTATTDGGLHEVMCQIAKTGKLHVIHAEANSFVQHNIDRLRKQGRNDIFAHLDSRPVLAELISCAKSMEMARDAEAKMAVAHISGGTVAEFLAAHRDEGYDILVETCPHYLFLTRDDVGELGPFAKINPGIRCSAEQQKLWEQLRAGVIDFIGSDHGPFLYEEKETGWDDIFDAPAGAVGLETLVPLFLDAVNGDKLSLPDVARLMSENTARHFGLWPKKGSLSVGADADFTVVDLERKQVVNRDEMYTKASDCALLYDGWELQGAVEATIVRGNVVMQDGEICGEEGYGELIKS